MDQIAFDSPAYLVLLAGLPLLWWLSRGTIAALGRVRGLLAVSMRTIVFLLLVTALAEAQHVRSNDRLTVFYLVDQSLSIAADAGEFMVRYVNEAIRRGSASANTDRAGVIVFGRDAAIEVPPLTGALQLSRIETPVARDQTNLAAAMKLAQASFPHDASRRVVLVTDGNQTTGNALAQARSLADSGIGIDVVAIRWPPTAEVAVEKIVLPPDVQRGQPFELRVVLNQISVNPIDAPPVPGKLQIVRHSASGRQTLVDQDVALTAGKRVFAVREQIDTPEFYTYQARFIAQRPEDDQRSENNEATAFTHVRGSGQVLVLEDHEHKGEFDRLIERLGAMNFEMTLRSTAPGELFTELAQLQPFDAVILADVPRDHFSDQQIEILVRNTRNLGAGLLMLGGPDSFGAGGWTDSPLERAMPVDFQVKNLKVMPVGALMLVIDRSGSMQGEKIQMSKSAAMAAIEVLGPSDQVGVVAFDTEAHTVVPMQTVGNGKQASARVAQLGADGGTNMMPGLQTGYAALLAVEAAAKHLVVVSDGRTEDGRYQAIAEEMHGLGITTTCVAIGADADSPLMHAIAQHGGGKFYRVDRPRAIPRILMKEARRVARPVVYERADGFSPQIQDAHEMVQGIDRVLPPITGFVLTTPKPSPLVEIPIISPQPSDNQINPVVASWTYGLGKAVALTTDGGRRWASAWADWPQYGQLMSQIVRWSMRPQSDDGRFAVNSDLRDGKVKVVVTALDRDDEFLNFLSMDALALSPTMRSIDFEIKQAAPGRYVGEFEATQPGSYLLVINPGPGQAPVRSGVTVAYSDEFSARDTNEWLLHAIVECAPKNGPQGKIMDAPASLPADQRLAQLLATDVFRHDLAKSTSNEPVWPLVVLAASVLFLADVLTRRVAIGSELFAAWLARVRAWFAGRAQPAGVEAAIERLRHRKAEVAGKWEHKLESQQLTGSADGKETTSTLVAERIVHQQDAQRDDFAINRESAAVEQDTYLDRLRRAKAQAQAKRRADQGIDRFSDN